MPYSWQDDVADLCDFHQVAACLLAFGRGDLEKGRKGDCREEILAERGLVVTLASPLEHKYPIWKIVLEALAYPWFGWEIALGT